MSISFVYTHFCSSKSHFQQLFLLENVYVRSTFLSFGNHKSILFSSICLIDLLLSLEVDNWNNLPSETKPTFDLLKGRGPCELETWGGTWSRGPGLGVLAWGPTLDFVCAFRVLQSVRMKCSTFSEENPYRQLCSAQNDSVKSYELLHEAIFCQFLLYT